MPRGAVVVLSRLCSSLRVLAEVHLAPARVPGDLHSTELLPVAAPRQRLAVGTTGSSGHNWRKMELKRRGKGVAGGGWRWTGWGGGATLKFRSELCIPPGGGWRKANAHSLPGSQQADLSDLAKLTPKGGGGSAPVSAVQTC